jgi:addiction module HigA family antidote
MTPRTKNRKPATKPGALPQQTIESQILAQELRTVMDAHKITAYGLAAAINVAHSQLYGLLQGGGRNMSPLLALKLSRYFDHDPLRWMVLQASADLAAAMAEHGDAVNAIVPHKDRQP